MPTLQTVYHWFARTRGSDEYSLIRRTFMVMRLRGLRSRQRCMTSMSARLRMGGKATRWLASMMACIFWMKGRWLRGGVGEMQGRVSVMQGQAGTARGPQQQGGKEC